MKTCSPQELSCILRQQFYWGIFSFGLRDVVNLSTTFFIQRFFTFFISFIKTRFLTFFILGVNVFYIYGLNNTYAQALIEAEQQVLETSTGIRSHYKHG